MSAKSPISLLIVYCLVAVPVALAQVAATTSAPARTTDEQTTFASPEEAVKALAEATKARDKEAIHKVFGPAVKDLVSGDEVQDREDFEEFSKAFAAMTELVKKDDSTVILHIGKENFPFPIPLVKKDGKWFFDTAAGKEEILNRRVGENELDTIKFCRAYVEAQFEYLSKDRDGDAVLQYAQKFVSTEGKKDGLYWSTKPDEPLSPLGELAAQATAEGYGKGDKKDNRPEPFHGYDFKILTRQGAKAAGGKYDYAINGRMLAGFALVAWPANWGNSGVMTFMVNSNGKVYQKNLGEKTADLVKDMTEYNPDETWTVVKN